MTATTAPITDDAEIVEAWLPQHVGLHGHAGVGKDTVAKILTEKYGYTRVAFADKVKEALYVLNPIVEQGYGGTEIGVKDLVDKYGWDTVKRNSPEVRRLLQVLGTEVGREMIGQNVWVDSVFKNLDEDKKYVFTDIRFVNEHHAIDSRLGLLIKIDRPGSEPANEHKSEKGLPDMWFDAHIVNDGTIEDLHTKVREILVHA